MRLKAYAKAKSLQKNQSVKFDQALKQEFTSLYNSLSFRQKVNETTFDSATISDMRKDYTDFKEQLKKNKTDSLSFEDAQSLVDKYSNYLFYGEVYPLISPLIAAPQYQKMYPA